MQTTATATRPRQKPARQQVPTPPQPRQPMTPDQMAALDVLLAAAKPGLELAVGPAGTEVQLTARLKRAKRYGYGAPTAILFLDALPALDGLTRTEFRVLLRVLARAPFGDNIAPVSAAAIAREIGLDRSHVAAAIRSLAWARILIADEAGKGTRRQFFRITTRLLWRGSAYGYQAAVAARPPLAMPTVIAVGVWRNFAFAAIILTAGLGQIPRDLYRAAAVDGLNAIERFRRITLPLLMPSLLVVLCVLTISYFNEVQVIIGLTGGGPINATTTLSYQLFQTGFVELNQGRGNAIAVVMFLINLVLVVAYVRLLGGGRGARA